MATNLLGYTPGNTFIHRINATSKLIAFLVTSVALMITYDTRLLVTAAILALLLFRSAHIRWRQVSLIVKIVAFVGIINLFFVWVFAPEYGVSIYHSRDVLWEGWGGWTITKQQLFYELNLFFKYFSTIPFALLFLFTTNPSEIASSLNRIGVSYKFSYALALTLRYVPDIQEEFHTISQAQQARGYEMSKKAGLLQRIKGVLRIITPLILSSFDRIETVSNAMTLRRFGRHKRRSWYTAKPFTKRDLLFTLAAIVILVISISLFWVNDGRFYNPFTPTVI